MPPLRRSALWLLALLLIGTSLPAFAVQPGKLRLLELPEREQVFIYVDGQPVTPQEGVIPVPPRWHEIQGEEPESSRVYHRMVEMEPHGFHSLTVVLCPLLALGRTQTPQAASGPPGPPGPAGEPANPAALQPTPPNLAGLLREALDSLVNDLEGRKRDLHETLRYRAGTPVPELYYYVPPMADIRPPGPPGPLGPWGPKGVPGDALLLRTATRQLLLDELKTGLNLRQLEEWLASIESQVMRLPSHGERTNFVPPARQAIPLTSRLKAQMDAAIQNQKREYEQIERERQKGAIVELGLTPAGPPGQPGRRGPDGQVPADAKPIRLTAQQVEQIRVLLKRDAHLQQRILRLRADLSEMGLWTAEASNMVAQHQH